MRLFRYILFLLLLPVFCRAQFNARNDAQGNWLWKDKNDSTIASAKQTQRLNLYSDTIAAKSVDSDHVQLVRPVTLIGVTKSGIFFSFPVDSLPAGTGGTGPANTDALPEGTTNKYYTDARVDTRLGTKTTDNITEGITNQYYTNARVDTRFDTRLATKTTDNLTEGTTNKYYTDARVDTRLGTKTTDNLTEGSTNKYYTDTRARAAISVTATGTSGAATYNSGTGVLNIPQYTGGGGSSALIYQNSADATVNNTATETSVLGTAGQGSKTIAANALTAGKTLHIVGYLFYATTASGATLTIRLKLGSTTLGTQTLSSGALGTSVAITSGRIFIDARIHVRTTGTSGTVMCTGLSRYWNTAVNQFESGMDWLDNAGSTSTINTTIGNDIDLTVQWASAASGRQVIGKNIDVLAY